MRGKRVKSLRDPSITPHPGRKLGGSVSDPPHATVARISPEKRTHSHERENARRRNQLAAGQHFHYVHQISKRTRRSTKP